MILQHTVVQRQDEFLVVYPTPGLEFVPTLVLTCRTQEQAEAEACRMNKSQQIRQDYFSDLARLLSRGVTAPAGGAQ